MPDIVERLLDLSLWNLKFRGHKKCPKIMYLSPLEFYELAMGVAQQYNNEEETEIKLWTAHGYCLYRIQNISSMGDSE